MFTVKEVANQLNVALTTVYALINAGQLKCYRIGNGRGVIRISESSLEEYLQTVETSRCANDSQHNGVTSQLRHIKL